MQENAPSYYESNPFSRRWRSGLAEMARRLLPAGWENLSLLDVGVGDGFTIRLVKPKGEVTGLDIDSSELAAANERGIIPKEGSAYDIPFPDGSFDIATCFEVLEHLDAPMRALKEIGRVLRPKGYLVASTPIPNLRWKVIWWFWTKLGPGKRWKNIPHVTELHIGGKSSEDGGLLAMLKELDFEVLGTGKCNFGMVAGLIAQKHG
ncbi:MAG: methyltransferase domain-containing protein [Nitrososphaerales archaeon]